MSWAHEHGAYDEERTTIRDLIAIIGCVLFVVCIEEPLEVAKELPSRLRGWWNNITDQW